MLKKIKLLTLLTTCLLYINLNAQDIQVVVHETFIYAPETTLEIIFDFEVINISNEEQSVFEVRTINNLPPNWTSSLCFGELCFPPEIDSVYTAPPFPDPPLQPGDTLITSLHVFTDQVSLATAEVQLQVGTFNNPNDRIIIDFTATTDPSVDVEDEEIPNQYFLSQNYPNPFNPSTKINYGVKEGGQVTLKVYNILGVEIATLVNGYKPAGTYEAFLNASATGGLSSGVYIYSLSVNGFRQTRKMILEK
jgi:hypothetical protein